jgi:hypothetical protein
MSAIRQFARQVVRRFAPEKIILFGSYAYGRPHADSDVDILVVMPARNEIDQAVRIDVSTRPHCLHPEEHCLAAQGRRFLPARNPDQGQSALSLGISVTGTRKKKRR